MTKTWYVIIAVLVVGGALLVFAPTSAPNGEISSDTPIPDAGNESPAMSVEVPEGITVEPVPINNAPPAAAPAPAVVNVGIRGFAYAPAEIRVTPGTKVVWRNEDSVRHNAVADNGAFSGPLLSQGESYEFTFTTKGAYAYHCAPHPFMKATVVVE